MVNSTSAQDSVVDMAFSSLESRVSSGYYSPGQKLPSVRKLAEEYGMSIGSVSKILQRLRDKGAIQLRQGQGAFVCSFDEQQKKRLKLGLFYFNKFGQSLSMERSPFGYCIFDGVQAYCGKNNYSLSVRPIYSDISKIGQIIEDIEECGLNGLILMYGGEARFRDYVHYFQESGIPMVLIDNPWREKHRHNYVCGDNLQIGIVAADYLFNLGHRNILHILQTDAKCFNDQYLGFKTALLRNGLEHKEEHLLINDVETPLLDTVRVAAAKILASRSGDPITAVYCCDNIALELIEHLRLEDINVPNDISILGSTGSKVGMHYHPALTVVSCNIESMGAKACEILHHLIDDPDSGPWQEVFEAHIVERESTGSL